MNNPCVIPTPGEDTVGDGRWMSMHARFVQEAKTTESEIVFIGDSIIQQMQFSTLWNEKISSLHCLNFGIGGDRYVSFLFVFSFLNIQRKYKFNSYEILIKNIYYVYEDL